MKKDKLKDSKFLILLKNKISVPINIVTPKIKTYNYEKDNYPI